MTNALKVGDKVAIDHGTGVVKRLSPHEGIGVWVQIVDGPYKGMTIGVHASHIRA